MTSIPAHEFYPQYCFHLSPTIYRWCYLRASDIASLAAPADYAGQDIFFYHNHPVTWVQVAGVVVAAEDYWGKRVYTVDDGSGVNIECVAQLPTKKPPLPAAPGGPARTTAVAQKPQQDPDREQKVPLDVDLLGQVVSIRGRLKLFREDQRQIKVEKVEILRSTQHEVRFWNKMADFRDSVLSRPWVLNRRVLERCRREAEEDSRRTKKKPRAEMTGDRVAEAHSTREGAKKAPSSSSRAPKIITGLERKRRRPKGDHSASSEGRSMVRA